MQLTERTWQDDLLGITVLGQNVRNSTSFLACGDVQENLLSTRTSPTPPKLFCGEIRPPITRFSRPWIAPLRLDVLALYLATKPRGETQDATTWPQERTIRELATPLVRVERERQSSSVRATCAAGYRPSVHERRYWGIDNGIGRSNIRVLAIPHLQHHVEVPVDSLSRCIALATSMSSRRLAPSVVPSSASVCVDGFRVGKSDC